MAKLDVQSKLTSYRAALKRLQNFARENAELMEQLHEIIEEYNVKRASLEDAVRSQGAKVTVGPFSVTLRNTTTVDTDTITLKHPRLMLEPGVVTKVDVAKLRDAAARAGVHRDVDESITTREPTVTVSKGEAKEIVFTWPQD